MELRSLTPVFADYGEEKGLTKAPPDPHAEDDYRTMAGRPLVWQWVARDLLAGANALHAHRRGPSSGRRSQPGDERIDTSAAPIILLYGMALENLLKGLLIAEGTPATVDGELNPDLKTHSLDTLWTRANLERDSETDSLLAALEWAVVTGARYPVGLKADPESARHLLIAGTHVDRIIRLFEKAEDALYSHHPSGLFEKTDLTRWGAE